MNKRTIFVETGLHIGPSYELAKTAKKYPCEITVKTRHGIFNVKSGLQLLQAGLEPGEKAEFLCDGISENEADKAIEKFFLQFFENEEEKRC